METRRGGEAGVAQLVEQLTCNQQVGGSIPFASSLRRQDTEPRHGASVPARRRAKQREEESKASRFSARESRACEAPRRGGKGSKASRFSAREGRACEAPRKRGGEVPKWTKGTDCKSVGFGLRRFESSPPHNGFEFFCGNSSVGRAPAFQAGGRGFEPRFPLLRSWPQ